MIILIYYGTGTLVVLKRLLIY